MSKSNIRKITADPTKCNIDPRRPSVFERLGTKPVSTTTGQIVTDYCRNWALNGNCSYGKVCKYANTHILISPSKRAKKDTPNVGNLTQGKDDPFKRITSKIISPQSPDLNLEEWNQTDLEYEDEKELERRRKLLQRELEIQMKKDKEVHGKERTKHKKKMSSSSSSHSSSSSSSCSSSSSDDSSSSSTSDSHKKVKKIKTKRHHSISSDYNEDKSRKKKLKLKRLDNKNEKVPMKKKRKVEPLETRDLPPKVMKTVGVNVVKKHAVMRMRSPVLLMTSPTKIVKDRNRSESPKQKLREEKHRHHRKGRDSEEPMIKEDLKKKGAEKAKELMKMKNRITEEKLRMNERIKIRVKEKEPRSRTPPIERLKHVMLPYPVQETSLLKPRRSRTPEKLLRAKRDLKVPTRHIEKIAMPGHSREIQKDREVHKCERIRERPPSPIRNEEITNKRALSLEHTQRKNISREIEEKIHPVDRTRQRMKEHREKMSRDDRSNIRIDPREKEEIVERIRDRPRERERGKEPVKCRDREISIVATTPVCSHIEKSRYREKEKLKDFCTIFKEDKNNSRDRRIDRDIRANELKAPERDHGPQRFEEKYDRAMDKEFIHKDRMQVERGERIDRFPRERSLDRPGEPKNIPGPIQELLPEREAILYDRGQNRHRRFNPRFERGHSTLMEHEMKDIPSTKLDRLPERHDSSRRSLEVDRNSDRGYPRMPSEHWDQPEELPARIDYHVLQDDRRKPVESRRYNSPFNERRTRDDGRTSARYPIQGERSFEDHHHPNHPVYHGEKMRAGQIREESSSNENWEMHHDMEHGRERGGYSGNAEWEEREWRPPGPRNLAVWERESLPRSEAHEEDWSGRYDSPVTEWKGHENRKWENQSLHLRGNSYRNDRVKDMEAGEVASHGKRREPHTPEMRDDAASHGSQQSSLQGSVKEEPINKKLMELAEGKSRKSREKSADSFKKVHLLKEKPAEPKEPPIFEAKRPCFEEPHQIHESDLSDISDDPDDILNMEEEETAERVLDVERETFPNYPAVNQENRYPSRERIIEDPPIFSSYKDESEVNIEDDNIEAMDFEEISDGELEEDIKTSGKGLGDALGVDWESLVKESQPRWPSSTQDAAQSRWQCKAIFQRIGISAKYAGADFIENLTKKYADDETKFLLSDVAMIHTGLLRKKLLHDPARGLLTSDYSFYRHSDKYENDNPEVLRPFTSLFEEAKLLLQQEA